MLTMRPQPVRLITGTTCRDTSNTPVRFTSMIRRQSVEASSSTDRVPLIKPALLTRMSIRDASLSTPVMAAEICFVLVTSTVTCCIRSLWVRSRS